MMGLSALSKGMCRHVRLKLQLLCLFYETCGLYWYKLWMKVGAAAAAIKGAICMFENELAPRAPHSEPVGVSILPIIRVSTVIAGIKYKLTYQA